LFLKDRAFHGVPGTDLAGLVAKRESARPTSKIGRKMRKYRGNVAGFEIKESVVSKNI
jgi:hypothetical protein